MKTRLLFTALLFAFGCITFAAAADDYIRESGWAGETFTSKVIKDLSFKDGDAEYIAYLVKWKDHEVVVAAPVSAAVPATKHYAVGDSIRCQMQQRDAVHANEGQSQLTFSLVSMSADSAARLQAIAAEIRARQALRESTAPVLKADQARLDAVAAEVAARRAKREKDKAAAEAPPAPKQPE